MTLTPTEKEDFTNKYLQFLVKSWTDEDFSALADANPRQALAETGIELPADATVEIITHDGDDVDTYTAGHDGAAAMDAQVALFERGQTSGHFRFHVPGTPTIATEDLDSLELSAVAGGAAACTCCCCSC